MCAVQDVWLFHSLTGSRWDDTTALARFNSRNGRWARLPNAPFTPRAEALHHFVIDNDHEYENTRWAPPAGRIVLLLFGGETGYACGNRHLSVCQNDVWQLSIVRPAEGADGGVLELGLSFQWQRRNNGSPGEPVQRLPFSPRCGMLPLFERRQYYWLYSFTTGLAGGQLSYTDTARCSAPIVTTNEVYVGIWPYIFLGYRWDRKADLPFSPRRSMMMEDAVVTNDELYGFENPDKTVTLAGGITYISHRFDRLLNRSVTTQAEVHADAWTCSMDLRPGPWTCDWRFTYPEGDLSLPDRAAPSGSLPVPVVFGSSAAYPMGHYLLNTRVGGAVPEAALQAWRRVRLRVDETEADSMRWSGEYNVTLMQQPNSFASRALASKSTTGEVSHRRYQLPLSYRVDEAELNSPSSSFVLGSDVLMTHTKSYWLSGLQPTFTTVESGGGRTSRLDHATAGTYDTMIISGGRSGSAYSSEWVSYETALCWWPEDPSYTDTLGAMRFVSLVAEGRRNYAYRSYWPASGVPSPNREWQMVGPDMLGAFHAADPIEVTCAAGWHFEPPLSHAADTAVLTCSASSEWVDVALGGIRRCVLDRVDCAYPLVDAGYEQCSEPLPVLRSAAVYTSDPRNSRGGHTENTDAATVTEVLQGTDTQRQLVLRGEWLTEPVGVVVGGRLCASPQLRNVSRYCAVSSTGQDVCRDYGGSVVCVLDEASLGVRQPVTLTTGRGSRRRSIDSIRVGDGATGREAVTVSLVEPRVISLRAVVEGSCDVQSADAPWRLTGCAMDAPLEVQMCGVGFEILYVVMAVPVVRVKVAYSGVEMQCRGWSRWDSNSYYCGMWDFWCRSEFVCALCVLNGRAGVTAQVALTSVSVSDTVMQTNANQNNNVSAAASVGFRSCDPGHKLAVNVTAGLSTEQCVPCPPGSSTMNTTGQLSCQPCAPGTFSNVSGAVDCQACPVDTVSSAIGATECDVCVGNRWQSHARQSECLTCKPNEYRVVASVSAAHTASTPPEPSCSLCPSGASCYLEQGALVAGPGSFLLIDQAAGAVSSVACDELACVESGGACLAVVVGPGLSGVGDTADDRPTAVVQVQTVQTSGLLVVNCCGLHRRHTSAADPSYVNVLCAECEAGYSELGGECVECASTNWAALTGLVTLALVLVWLLHRLCSSADSSATASIVAYSVQMSLLFQSTQRLPSLLQLLEVDLLSNTRGCVVPLSGQGKLLARLLSPLLFVLLLAALLGVQLCMRWGMDRRTDDSVLRRVYTVLFVVRPADDKQRAAGTDERAAPGVAATSTARAGPLTERLLPDCEREADGAAEDERKHHDGDTAVGAGTEAGSDAGASMTSTVTSVATASINTSPVQGHHRGTESRRTILLAYHRTLLRLLLYSYNAVSTACLAFLDARAVGEYGHRLKQYPSIDTATAQYRALRPLIVALLVWPVLSGPVLLLAYLTWQQRGQLLGGGGGKQRAETEAESETMARSPVRASITATLLTSSLRPSCWPMGAVVVTRRLVLILVLTFAEQGVWVWASMVNMLVLSLHLLTWPYVQWRDNVLEAVGLLCLSMQTMLLASPSEGRLLGVALWLLLGAPVAALLVLNAAEQVQRRRVATAGAVTLDSHAAEAPWSASDVADK